MGIIGKVLPIGFRRPFVLADPPQKSSRTQLEAIRGLSGSLLDDFGEFVVPEQSFVDFKEPTESLRIPFESKGAILVERLARFSRPLVDFGEFFSFGRVQPRGFQSVFEKSDRLLDRSKRKGQIEKIAEKRRILRVDPGTRPHQGKYLGLTVRLDGKCPYRHFVVGPILNHSGISFPECVKLFEGFHDPVQGPEHPGLFQVPSHEIFRIIRDAFFKRAYINQGCLGLACQ